MSDKEIKITSGLNDYFAEELVKEWGPDGAREKVCGPALEAVERVIAASSPAMNAASQPDLVKRLRECAGHGEQPIGKLMGEAADEITRLAAPVSQGSTHHHASTNEEDPIGGKRWSKEAEVLVAGQGSNYAAPVDNSTACSGFANSESGFGGQGSATSVDELAAHVHAVLYTSPEAADACALESVSRSKGSATSGEVPPEVIADRQYLAGFDAGFKAGAEGDDTARAAVHEARSREIRSALAASAEQSNPNQVDREKIMQQWDQYRALIASGFTGSRPRDWFEALLDSLLIDKAASAEQSNTPVPRVGGNTNEESGCMRCYFLGCTCGDCMAKSSHVATPVAERAAAIEIDGRTYTADEIKGRIKQLDAEADAVSEQHAAGAKRIEELEALLAECAAAPASVPEGFALVPMKLTEEMHVAAVRAIVRSTGNDDFPPAVWSAMLGAAPEVAQPAAQGERFKDHNVRQLVNDLRDIATTFHATQQLRSRIQDAVMQFLATPAPTAGEPSAEPDGLCNAALRAAPACQHEADARDAARYRWLRDADTDVGNVMDKKFAPDMWEYRAGAELDVAIDAAMGADAASRSRAEGGMHDDDTPISMSTYGSLAECEAEQARPDFKATQGRTAEGEAQKGRRKILMDSGMIDVTPATQGEKEGAA